MKMQLYRGGEKQKIGKQNTFLNTMMKIMQSIELKKMLP